MIFVCPAGFLIALDICYKMYKYENHISYAQEEDTEESIEEQVIDNDEGEELHLKKLAELDSEGPTADADGDDQPAEKSSCEFMNFDVV